MGGCGSGRRVQKYLAEDCLSLDVAKLREHIAIVQEGPYPGSGMTPGYNPWAKPTVSFMVRRVGKELVVELHELGQGGGQGPTLIDLCSLQFTVPHFGGRRWWLVCPSCKRRCGKLYRPQRFPWFGCQRCLQLAYHCQRGGRITRLIWKIERLKYRLGARGQDTAAAAPTPLRQKGMRWKRYEELVDQLREVEDRYYCALGGWWEGLKRKQVEA